MIRFLLFCFVIFRGIVGVCGVQTTEVAVGSLPWSDVDLRDVTLLVDRTKDGAGPLRCVGREFSHGIAAQPSYDLIYNVNGMARRFQGWLGMVEAAPAEAECMMEVRLDRRLVRSIILRGGEVPQELTLDLTGIQQLELMLYNRTSHRPEVILGEPVLMTDQPDALRQTLKTEAERMAKLRASTPMMASRMLPDWKTMRLEAFPAGIYGEGYRLDNGRVFVELIPGAGRISAFGRSGGANLLMPPPPESTLPDLRRGRAEYYCHTHFARPEPRDYFFPGEDLHQFAPYTIEFGPGEGEVVMRSLPSYYFYLEQEYHLRLTPGVPELELTTRMRNLGSFSRECAIWSVTVLPTPSIESIEIAPAAPEDVFYPERTAAFPRAIADGRRVVLADAAEILDRVEAIEIQCADPAGKLTARLKSGERFTLLLPDEPTGSERAKYRTHFYAIDTFTELELHSPLVTLPPGGELQLRELWRLEPPVQSVENE